MARRKRTALSMRGNSLLPGRSRRRRAHRMSLSVRISSFLILILGNTVFPLAAGVRPVISSPRRPRSLLIGAGAKGWDLIEYKEIYASASEYLGAPNVARLVFSGDRSMLAEFREALREVQPSHYYYDPRSGSQRFFPAIWQALVIGVQLERLRITPICALTDFPVKRWRLQTAIVSARSGVVTSLMSPSVVRTVFPHRRIIGPMPFPLSVATLKLLQEKKSKSTPQQSGLGDKVVFVGMLYEPRKSTIEAIQQGLARRGVPMEIIGRMPDGSRIPDDEYWNIVSTARLVVCTSSQISGRHTDFNGHNHFIYRFIEVTAAGTALAIEPVEDSEHLLRPDVDYIAYSSAEEAVEKIAGAWESPSRIDWLAERGLAQTSKMIGSSLFWRSVFLEN